MGGTLSSPLFAPPTLPEKNPTSRRPNVFPLTRRFDPLTLSDGDGVAIVYFIQVGGTYEFMRTVTGRLVLVV